MNPTILTSDLVTGLLFLAGLWHIAVTSQIQADLTAFIGAAVGLLFTGMSLYSHWKIALRRARDRADRRPPTCFPGSSSARPRS